MCDYKIITDSACDLPQSMLDSLDLRSIPLHVTFRGENRNDTVDEGWKEVFDGLRDGEPATTSAVNPSEWASCMEAVLAQGQDALVLAFSSGLSTTYQSAVIAAEDLMEKYPGRAIRVVDTLCASLGQGLLVWYACKKRDEGLSLDELAAWLEENKLHLCHWFTVDDLMFLKRGGRVSAATAAVGTMLKIKPVMHVDNAGHLINVSKARGRKASIDAMAAKIGETGLDPQNQVIFISHGDCIEDARYLEQKVRDTYHPLDVVISYVGPVIGSHSGPGTLALFFLGSKR